MKILITASGRSLDDPVDPRFGRAAWFLIVDTETGDLLEALDNGSGQGAAQGAGVQAAQAAARAGVEGLVTGHCGPKAFNALLAANIRVFTGAEGTVREALEMYRGGRLVQAGEADVRGHW